MKIGLPNYVELPAADIAAAKTFYADVFGWGLVDYGPSYACTTTGTVDVGLQGDPDEASKAPLPVLPVTDIDAALAAVIKAGGRIVRPIFAFPGGRRFQFLDPNGNELAIMQADD
jgi:predicted enzyme related to lactoylglutathione lyase